MIGNAVPVPLAKKIGGEFLKVLIRDFENQSKEGIFELKPKIKIEQERVWSDAIKRTTEMLGETLAKGTQIMKRGKTVEDAIELDEEDDKDDRLDIDNY